MRLFGQVGALFRRHSLFPFSFLSRRWQKPPKLDHLGGRNVLQIDPDIFSCDVHDLGNFFKHLAHQGLFDLGGSALPNQAVHIHLRRGVHSATHKVIALIGRIKQNLGKEPGSAGLGVVGRCDGLGDL